MGLMEFLNNQPIQENREQIQQKSQFTNNKNINNFCEKFFEKAGPNYRNTLPDFIKLAFLNVGLLQEILKSPEIKEIENLANTAMNKGLINQETLGGFKRVLNLFK